MPWIILHANGEELARHDLVSPVVIGRAPDCDIAIKDIMLSRTHCRLEPAAGGGEAAGWKLIDLGSRNGTRVGWDTVRVHVLRDGDHVRMGRTRMIYFAGEYVPPPHGRRAKDPDRVVRPADPHEALSGTVTDFVLLDEHAGNASNPEADDDGGMPSPQPRPVDPESYGSATVESLINDLASSVWEREHESEREYPSSSALEESAGGAQLTNNENGVATVTTVARPRIRARPLPRVISPAADYRQLPRRLAAETDLSLQADEAALAALAAMEAQPAPPYHPPPMPAKPNLWPVTAMVLAALVGTGIMLMSLWLLTVAP